MEGVEKYNLVGGKTCKEVLAKYPNYKVFWRSGFAYRGATESEDDKQMAEELGCDFLFGDYMCYPMKDSSFVKYIDAYFEEG